MELHLFVFEPVALRPPPLRLPLHRIGGFLRPPQGTDGEGLRDLHRLGPLGHGGLGDDLRHIGPHR